MTHDFIDVNLIYFLHMLFCSSHGRMYELSNELVSQLTRRYVILNDILLSKFISWIFYVHLKISRVESVIFKIVSGAEGNVKKKPLFQVMDKSVYEVPRTLMFTTHL